MESQKSTSAQLSTAQAALAAEQTRGEAATKRETDAVRRSPAAAGRDRFETFASKASAFEVQNSAQHGV